MIRVSLFDPETGVPLQGGWDLMDAWGASQRHFMWIDMEGEEQSDEESLLGQFRVHPLAILLSKR